MAEEVSLVNTVRELGLTPGKAVRRKLPERISISLEKFAEAEDYLRVLGLVEDRENARTSLELMENSYYSLWEGKYGYLKDLKVIVSATDLSEEVQVVVQRICLAAVLSLFGQELRYKVYDRSDIEFFQLGVMKCFFI
jgi:hypothetical protein